MEDKIKKLHELYNEILLEQSKELVKDKVCICCEKNIIKPLYPAEEIPVDPLKQERGPWNNGVVEVISGGFGSIHDLAKYYFSICDTCITDKLSRGIIEDQKIIRKKLSKLGLIENLSYTIGRRG